MHVDDPVHTGVPLSIVRWGIGGSGWSVESDGKLAEIYH